MLVSTVPTPLPTYMDTEPMEPTPILTTARGLLMLSPRLMPIMVLMAMASPLLDMAMVLAMPDTLDMVPTPMPPTHTASRMSSTHYQSRPPSTNAEAQKQTKSLTKFDFQCLYKSFVI